MRKGTFKQEYAGTGLFWEFVVVGSHISRFCDGLDGLSNLFLDYCLILDLVLSLDGSFDESSVKVVCFIILWILKLPSMLNYDTGKSPPFL